MAKTIKPEPNTQEIIDECNELLDRVGVPSGDDWQSSDTGCKSRLAYRVHLLANRKEPGWDFETIIVRLRALVEGDAHANTTD